MNQTESEITDISGTYKPCIYGKVVAAEYAAAFFVHTIVRKYEK